MTRFKESLIVSKNEGFFLEMSMVFCKYAEVDHVDVMFIVLFFFEPGRSALSYALYTYGIL